MPDSSGHFPPQPLDGGSVGRVEQRDSKGRLLTEILDAPVIDSLKHLDNAYRAQLEVIAQAPRTKGKLEPDEMRELILTLCRGHYVTGTSLAELVGRSAEAFRKQHLRPLVQQGKLQFAFPTAPTHEMQAYRTTESE